MAARRTLFTSESVTEGHPDKLADQISDAILDAYLAQDPLSRVACETSVTTGLVLLIGEVTSKGNVNVARVARDTIARAGYTEASFGLDAEHAAVLVSLDQQSSDIAQGVNQALEHRSGELHDGYLDSVGAGDQGMVFGFASDETVEYLPTPISLAHALTRRLAEVRKSGELKYLRPDGKSQVTVEYEGDKPVRVDTVLISAQHSPDVTAEQIRQDIERLVIRHTIPAALLDDKTKIFVNPTGRFVVGGPHGDAGLTGRKIIVDTYGGFARHGGGAFSGKDPTKVDRSGAYAARYVAKNVVAARYRSPMPSAWRGRSRSWWKLSVPVRFPMMNWPDASTTALTCGRPPSSSSSTCVDRSTDRPHPTATLGAWTWISPGSGPTG